MQTVESLIRNAAFMAVSLEELQEIINEEGYTVEYQNGANQSGTKQSDAVKTHIAMTKNHAAIIKQLRELVPPEKKKKAVCKPLRGRIKMPFSNCIYEYYDGITTGKNCRREMGAKLTVDTSLAGGFKTGFFFSNAKKANKGNSALSKTAASLRGRTDLLKLASAIENFSIIMRDEPTFKLSYGRKRRYADLSGLLMKITCGYSAKCLLAIGRKNGKIAFSLPPP